MLRKIDLLNSFLSLHQNSFLPYDKVQQTYFCFCSVLRTSGIIRKMDGSQLDIFNLSSTKVWITSYSNIYDIMERIFIVFQIPVVKNLLVSYFVFVSVDSPQQHRAS
jgi:hypothetical protein